MADDLFDVAGKVALVTGGTSGIGAMIAEGYVRRGVRTYIAARNLARAQEAAAEIAVAGGHCVGLAADLGEANGAAALIDAFRAYETSSISSSTMPVPTIAALLPRSAQKLGTT